MAIYSGFSHKKIVIFHFYVSSPEGSGDVDIGLMITGNSLYVDIDYQSPVKSKAAPIVAL